MSNGQPPPTQDDFYYGFDELGLGVFPDLAAATVWFLSLGFGLTLSRWKGKSFLVLT